MLAAHYRRISFDKTYLYWWSMQYGSFLPSIPFLTTLKVPRGYCTKSMTKMANLIANATEFDGQNTKHHHHHRHRRRQSFRPTDNTTTTWCSVVCSRCVVFDKSWFHRSIFLRHRIIPNSSRVPCKSTAVHRKIDTDKNRKQRRISSVVIVADVIGAIMIFVTTDLKNDKDDKW